MVMDHVRTCGVTRMKLWGEDGPWVPVRWIRAQPGARDFPGLSAFRWSENYMDGGVYLGPPVLDPEWTYDEGVDYVGYIGEHFCGREGAFRTGGIPGEDVGIETTADGSSPCCRPAERDPTGRIVIVSGSSEPEVPRGGICWGSGGSEIVSTPWQKCDVWGGGAHLVDSVPGGSNILMRHARIICSTPSPGDHAEIYIIEGGITCRWAWFAPEAEGDTWNWDGQTWLPDSADIYFFSGGSLVCNYWMSGDVF